MRDKIKKPMCEDTLTKCVREFQEKQLLIHSLIMAIIISSLGLTMIIIIMPWDGDHWASWAILVLCYLYIWSGLCASCVLIFWRFGESYYLGDKMKEKILSKWSDEKKQHEMFRYIEREIKETNKKIDDCKREIGFQQMDLDPATKKLNHPNEELITLKKTRNHGNTQKM